MKSQVAEYYQKLLSITNKYLNSVDTDFDALMKLKELNAEYESLIGKENLTNDIPKVNYDLDSFEKFLADPDKYQNELRYLQNNWMPSSC